MTSANSQHVTLADTQLITRSAAAQRDDHRVIAPEHLTGAIAQRSLTIMQSKGLIFEVEGEAGAYVLTELALQVLGIEPSSTEGGTSTASNDPPFAGDAGESSDRAETTAASKAPGVHPV